ncbi:acyloxyacyl hydrolase [Phaeobacter sp. QD34_3]|uniref:acyloxyacyl hydrolase n=1 Tax=unclassified Phaeobacter TaxID=2621772 RepID=UPI00237F318E|nr:MULTISPECIES: acyloxyacyl hydrolase [unclassified Phaeobacter]MDE4133425.1 acyloxyacyl hydrolase [Phaeobacter sp. QD34_3]MDE4137061.1 acyloxyacyl hydrolase [Phaeobacter sp. QD34_24]
MKYIAALTAVLLSAHAAHAEDREISIGIGYSDYSRPGSENGALVSLDYRHSPFWEKGNFAARFGAALDVQETGDVFIGAGVAGRWDLGRAWFIDASILPGAYFESVALNDLGSTFEIRSEIGVGRGFANGTAVSLAISHKSNASTASLNPGVNSVHLRWHIPL